MARMCDRCGNTDKDQQTAIAERAGVELCTRCTADFDALFAAFRANQDVSVPVVDPVELAVPATINDPAVSVKVQPGPLPISIEPPV